MPEKSADLTDQKWAQVRWSVYKVVPIMMLGFYGLVIGLTLFGWWLLGWTP